MKLFLNSMEVKKKIFFFYFSVLQNSEQERQSVMSTRLELVVDGFPVPDTVDQKITTLVLNGFTAFPDPGLFPNVESLILCNCHLNSPVPFKNTLRTLELYSSTLNLEHFQEHRYLKNLVLNYSSTGSVGSLPETVGFSLSSVKMTYSAKLLEYLLKNSREIRVVEIHGRWTREPIELKFHHNRVRVLRVFAFASTLQLWDTALSSLSELELNSVQVCGLGVFLRRNQSIRSLKLCEVNPWVNLTGNYDSIRYLKLRNVEVPGSPGGFLASFGGLRALVLNRVKFFGDGVPGSASRLLKVAILRDLRGVQNLDFLPNTLSSLVVRGFQCTGVEKYIRGSSRLKRLSTDVAGPATALALRHTPSRIRDLALFKAAVPCFSTLDFRTYEKVRFPQNRFSQRTLLQLADKIVTTGKANTLDLSAADQKRVSGRLVDVLKRNKSLTHVNLKGCFFTRHAQKGMRAYLETQYNIEKFYGLVAKLPDIRKKKQETLARFITAEPAKIALSYVYS